jgi:hypothetical protein
MSNPSLYPPEAGLKILAERLAARVVPLAQLPGNAHARTDDQPLLAERIVQLVLRIRDRDRRARGQTAGGLLHEAADAARRLDDAYSRMNRSDREWVEHIKQSQLQFGETNDIGATIANLSMLLHSALGKTYPVPKDRSRKQFGIKNLTVKDQLLRELVFGLLSAADDTGGKFEFNVNTAGGTLGHALDRLRPYLPDGLVPEPLRGRTIQRLITEFSRLNR